MRSIFSQTKNKNNNIGAYLFSGSVYKASLTHKGTEILLYSIFVALAFPILSFFIASNIDVVGMTEAEIAAHMWMRLRAFLSTESPLALLWGMGSGVISALVSFGYLFNKKHAGFVCALPVKRSAFAISNAASSLCTAIVSWIPAALLLVIGTLCMSSLRPYFGAYLLDFFGAFLTYLSVFVFFFGLTALAVGLCGTLPMTVLMLAFLAFFPLLFLMLFVGTAESFIDHINWGYYIDEDSLPRISSVVRIFSEIAKEKSAGFLLSTAGLGIFYFVIFAFLAIKRKNEATGNHFVWSFVRECVKYLCMILAGTTAGLLFYLLSNRGVSVFWMLIGTAIGAAIAWMLCNLTFFKTGSLLFYGKRGMAITLASLLLFMGLMPLDLLGLEDYVPSNHMIASIEMSSDVGMVRIKDKSLIRMYQAMIKNATSVSQRNGTVDLDPNSSGITLLTPQVSASEVTSSAITSSSAYPYVASYITSVFHTKYLIPIARYDHVLLSDYRTFITAFASSESFVEEYVKPMRRFAENKTAPVFTSLSFGSDIFYECNIAEYLEGHQITELADIYEREVRALGSSPMQNQIVGYLHFYQNGIDYPIFEDCTESIAWLEKTFDWEPTANTASLAKIEPLIKEITLCYGYDEIRKLTFDELSSYFESGALSYETVYMSDHRVQHFTLYDINYSVHVEFYRNDVIHAADDDNYKTYQGDSIQFYFFEGKAPQS